MKVDYLLLKRPIGRAMLPRFLWLLVIWLLPGVVWAIDPIKLEAETATLNGVSVATTISGYSGAGYAWDFSGANNNIVFQFQALAGQYDLVIQYTSPYGEKGYGLDVNGVQADKMFAGPVTGFSTTTAGRYTLVTGQNTITISRGWRYFGIDYIALAPVSTAPPTVVPLVNGRAEAEAGTLTGVQVATATAKFSGAGYVTGFDDATDNVSITFDNPRAGLYKLVLGYSSPYGEKGYDLQVNSEKASGMFVGTGAVFGSADAGTYLLPKGLNTVVVGRGWGYFDIDYVQLTPATAPLPVKPSKQLIDAQATASTRALYAYLVDLYGTKVLAGQHNTETDGFDDIQYVLDKTGKEPAVGSFDLIEYSPSRVANSSQPKGAAESYLAWGKKGTGIGIVSLMWHWNAPTDLINTADNPWWRGFYTDGTTFDLQVALADKTSPRYQLLLRDIDSIAVQLQKFQAADMPVLWRPLHEAAGGWFWWGAKGAGPFKELWHILYDRLTNYHQLHNLIWVYASPQTPTMDWYPGAAYVDITGVDLYVDPTANMSSDWAISQQLFGEKKMVALTESGNLPDPDKVRGFATWWSWFTVWEGADYIRKQPLDLLQRVYQDPDVITRDELPNWRQLIVTGTAARTLSPESLALYPNPATGYSLNVALTLSAAQRVVVSLTNTLGQRIVQTTEQLRAGANQFQVPISTVAAGIYQLTIQAPNQPVITKRVLINR